MSLRTERAARTQKLLTIEQHDHVMDVGIASGEAKTEPQAEAGKVVLSGIVCPRCGFRMLDISGEEVDPEGKKFRMCGCFRCGHRVWRRTP
jgi:DNA-directed RNA polymerase subunit RPC12/RpoP